VKVCDSFSKLLFTSFLTDITDLKSTRICDKFLLEEVCQWDWIKLNICNNLFIYITNSDAQLWLF